MRHLPLSTALLAMTAIAVACSSPGSSSNGGASQAASSEGAGASQPAASSGGGGGGGGANGSVTYEISGDYKASGELPFLAGGLSLWVESAGGWVANFSNPSGGDTVVLINTQAASGTPGQIFEFGNGEILVTATSAEGSACTFTLTKNDSSGLTGDVKCTDTLAIDNSTGAQKHVQLTAHWDAHP